MEVSTQHLESGETVAAFVSVTFPRDKQLRAL